MEFWRTADAVAGNVDCLVEIFSDVYSWSTLQVSGSLDPTNSARTHMSATGTRGTRLHHLLTNPLQNDKANGVCSNHTEEAFFCPPMLLSHRPASRSHGNAPLPRAQSVRCVIPKRLLERKQTLRIALAFHQWRRAAQIQPALDSYRRTLLRRHRVDSLQRALLRRCWETHAQSAFAQWQRFAKQSSHVLFSVARCFTRQRMRLALGKWFHRTVLAERLEEEAIAYVLVRRQRQQQQVRLHIVLCPTLARSLTLNAGCVQGTRGETTATPDTCARDDVDSLVDASARVVLHSLPATASLPPSLDLCPVDALRRGADNSATTRPATRTLTSD